VNFHGKIVAVFSVENNYASPPILLDMAIFFLKFKQEFFMSSREIISLNGI